jgi:hypothetical protein
MYDLEMKELLQLTEFVPRVRQPAPTQSTSPVARRLTD